MLNKKYCLVLLALSLNSYADKSGCRRIREKFKKDDCYLKKAVQTNNTFYCDKIKTLALKGLCQQASAKGVPVETLKSGDPSACEKMTGLEKRNCITLMAVKKKDHTLCKKLKDSKFLATCYLGVSEKTGEAGPCEYSPTLQDRFTCLVNITSLKKNKPTCLEAKRIAKLPGKGSANSAVKFLQGTLKEYCEKRDVFISF